MTLNFYFSTTCSFVRPCGGHRGWKVIVFMGKEWNLLSRRLNVHYSLTRNCVSSHQCNILQLQFVGNQFESSKSRFLQMSMKKGNIICYSP